MKVTMKLEFDDEDILAMCRAKIETVECPCEGYFDLRFGPSYEHSVIAEFNEGKRPPEEESLSAAQAAIEAGLESL